MKISIIIPTIGRQTLLNVLVTLIYKNSSNIKLQIIIIFDGKETKDYKKIKQRFCNIAEIDWKQTNHKVGAAGARNLGINYATGEIIAFLGDDTIPEKNWLKHVYDFHKKFPEPEIALLGKVSWTNQLMTDPFHRWLDSGVQFNFKLLEYNSPDYRFFYTSNISLKKLFIKKMRFRTCFKGWGFEDTEFGYRLEQKGLKIIFNKLCIVYHDHPQNIDDLKKNSKSARKNAIIFNNLHPEVSILPTTFKYYLLRFLISSSWIFSFFSKKITWWRIWKKIWIGIY